MIKYDVIVLGAGLSGLESAAILSKEGLNVCILDKNKLIGGMIQSFKREGVIFNTGFNYAESLGKGEVLNRYLAYLDVVDSINLKKLDEECFEEIHLGDKHEAFPIAQGIDSFIDKLSLRFPAERSNLHKYIKAMENINNTLPHYNLDNFFKLNVGFDYFADQSAYEFLNSVTSNSTLRSVLAGNSILHAGQKDKLPAYVLSLINYSFINSAWRIIGGCYTLADALANRIKQSGASIFSEREVSEIIVKDTNLFELRCKNGEIYHTKKIISSIHPQRSLELIKRSKIKPVYRNRINSLQNSIGMFTLYIVLKKKKIKYKNRNFHVFKSENVWCVNYNDWPENYMLYMTEDTQNLGYAQAVTVLTYMKYDEVKEWKDTYVEKRGETYKAFKNSRVQRLISFVEKKFPDIKGAIKNYYSSTPLTYRDYTGTAEGSAYGIMKDYKYPLKTMVLPATRIENFFLTGQNLNLHGILGTTISSFVTCSIILGQDYLMQKVIKR